MLNGKIAVVTGAGQGIGSGIAAALCRQGARVVVADVNAQNAEQTAADLRASGGDAVAFSVDVTQAAQVAALFNSVCARFGRIDVLVNNAGIVSQVPTVELTEAQWRRVLDVNLTGVLLCCQAAARAMMARDGGSIINIASAAARAGSPGYAAYCASKAGVVALTRVMAVEWGPHNIRVNSVSPGSIDTELSRSMRRLDPEGYARRDQRVPLRRPAQVDDVANVVVFLASDKAGYVSGNDTLVDGGIMSAHPGYVS